MYKVRRKTWGLSGSPTDVFDPAVWCGAATTLCARDVETAFPWWRSAFVEATSKLPRELCECLRGEPLWKVKWCSWERLGYREAILLCGVL
jgi:hypothetical protein